MSHWPQRRDSKTNVSISYSSPFMQSSIREIGVSPVYSAKTPRGSNTGHGTDWPVRTFRNTIDQNERGNWYSTVGSHSMTHHTNVNKGSHPNESVNSILYGATGNLRLNHNRDSFTGSVRDNTKEFDNMTHTSDRPLTVIDSRRSTVTNTGHGGFRLRTDSIQSKTAPASINGDNERKYDAAVVGAVSDELDELIAKDLFHTPALSSQDPPIVPRESPPLSTEIEELDRYIERLQMATLRLQKERDSYKDTIQDLRSQIVDQEGKLIIAHAEAARYKGLLEMYWVPLFESRMNIANHQNDDHISRYESSLNKWKGERKALESAVNSLSSRVKEQSVEESAAPTLTPAQVQVLLSSRDDAINNLQHRNNVLTKQLMEATMNSSSK